MKKILLFTVIVCGMFSAAAKEKLGFNVESQESISQMLTSNLQKTYNNEPT